MFEKNGFIGVNQLPTYSFGTSETLKRAVFLPSGNFLIVGNNENEYVFYVYDSSGLSYSFNLDYSYGQLINILPYKDEFFLEFKDHLSMYTEEYNIVKVKGTCIEQVGSFIRESYAHELDFHYLFVKNGDLYLHLIRHNRIHSYRFKNNSFEEETVMEGGKWFLCGKYTLCLIGQTIEFYNSDLDLIDSMEYDYEIDQLIYSNSASSMLFAIAMVDISNQRTALLVYQEDTQILNVANMEHIISDMGVSAGRVWLNPYSIDVQQELGGCIIYDKYAWPIYTHIRVKNPIGAPIGAYPPPFHRSLSIQGMPEGMTLVAEANKLLLIDYNCRVVQEIPITHFECFAISENGEIANLILDRSNYLKDEFFCHDDIKLELYRWTNNNISSKVIKLSALGEEV